MGCTYRDDGLGERCFASSRRQSCRNSALCSCWQSQPAKRKIQARWTCKFRWGQTIYAAERLRVERLTSSDPAGLALRRQQASTPPQSKCHKRGSSRWAARAGGASGTTVASCAARNINGTPDGRHLGHRRRRAKSFDPTEKWLHRLDPGHSASLDSEI